MKEGSLVNDHVLKMIGYIEKLANLGFFMDNDLYIDLVLQSLPESFFSVHYELSYEQNGSYASGITQYIETC